MFQLLPNSLHAGGCAFIETTITVKTYLDATTIMANGSTNSTFGIGYYESTGGSSPMTSGYFGEAIVLSGDASAADVAAIQASQKLCFAAP